MRELQESLACGLAFSQSIASPFPHPHSPNQGDETDKMKTCIQKISCMHSDVLLSTNFCVSGDVPELPPGAPYDYSVASDVVYLPQLYKPLAATIQRHMHIGATVFVACQARREDNAVFCNLLEAFGLVVRHVAVSELPQRCEAVASCLKAIPIHNWTILWITSSGNSAQNPLEGEGTGVTPSLHLS